jgi:hypothetical protein
MRHARLSDEVASCCVPSIEVGAQLFAGNAGNALNVKKALGRNLFPLVDRARRYLQLAGEFSGQAPLIPYEFDAIHALLIAPLTSPCKRNVSLTVWP